MKFLSKYKTGTLRTVFTILCLFIFVNFTFVFLNVLFLSSFTIDDCLWIDKKSEGDTVAIVFIVDITPGGVADEAGLIENDLLLAIEGKTFEHSFDAQRILNEYGNADITYTIKRGDLVFDVPIRVYKFFNTQFLIVSLLGLAFLIIGYIVGYANPKGQIPFLFFLLGCTAPMGLMTFSANVFIEPFGVFFFTFILSGVLFFPLFVQFFLNFPLKYKFRFRKTFITALYVISAICLFLLQKSWIIFISFATLLIILGLCLFLNSYRKITEPSEKKPLRAIISGLLIGSTGLLYFLAVTLLVKKPFFLINPVMLFPSALSFAIPVSFGYSIIRYKILDTETVIKRWLVFGIITVFIVGVYLLIVLAMNAIFEQYFEESRQLLTIITIIVITFSLDFVNKRAKVFVDKQFYRKRYNYRKSLLNFSMELPYFRNINEVLKQLSISVTETMGIKNLKIWLASDEYYRLINSDADKFNRIDVDEVTLNKIFEKLHSKNKDPKVINEATLTEYKIDGGYKEILSNNNVVLSIPIQIKSRLIGSLNFGSKPSGNAYSEEDIDLLKTLASQVAIAFENNRLKQEKLQKRKMEEDLSIAKNIQEGLLPKWNKVHEKIEIGLFSKPAREIGGDFYDIIEIDENKFLIVIADVSGKGIPAAIYMSKIQAMIQLASNIFKSPREILLEVNKNMKDQMERNSFVTSILAMFDLKNYNVSIVRAGHNPVLYSINGTTKFLQSKGMGLGLTDEEVFADNLEELELQLTGDDLFLFYSDGLTEAMNSIREEFGAEKIKEIVVANRTQKPDELISKIVSGVETFTDGSEQHDDITMVLVKTKKSNNDRKILT